MVSVASTAVPRVCTARPDRHRARTPNMNSTARWVLPMAAYRRFSTVIRPARRTTRPTRSFSLMFNLVLRG
jgi:hypothetical protein